jgi:hypothetical protein
MLSMLTLNETCFVSGSACLLLSFQLSLSPRPHTHPLSSSFIVATSWNHRTPEENEVISEWFRGFDDVIGDLGLFHGYQSILF